MSAARPSGYHLPPYENEPWWLVDPRPSSSRNVPTTPYCFYSYHSYHRTNDMDSIEGLGEGDKDRDTASQLQIEEFTRFYATGANRRLRRDMAIEFFLDVTGVVDEEEREEMTVLLVEEAFRLEAAMKRDEEEWEDE